MSGGVAHLILVGGLVLFMYAVLLVCIYAEIVNSIRHPDRVDPGNPE